MLDWPLPGNIKKLRRFIGLTGYYRKLFKDYAKIASPLIEQLRKYNYCWTEAATKAFTALQKAMVEAPILVLPDFSSPFTNETDASDFGLGAVLLQHDHPIAYSKLLGPRTRLKFIYEKELMAIVSTMQKWRHYLLGRRFIVRTDQQSLRFLLEQREIGMEYQ